MKKAICLLALCAFAVTASASVDFFFTKGTDPWGLVNPANALKVTGTNSTDYADGWALNANGVPDISAGIADVEIDLNDPNPGFVYMWGRFTSNEPVGAKINGISMDLLPLAAGQYPGQLAYYRVDNELDFNLPTQFKRWDGEVNVLQSDPTGLIAITAFGMSHIPTNNATTAANLYRYDVAKGGGIFLIGAVDSSLMTPGTFEFSHPGSIPVNYANPQHPLPSVNDLNKVLVIPEPASMLLLGLAGLLIRRR